MIKFIITREALLKPLQLVAGVVERRQTLPVLSNVLLTLEKNQLSLVGTDLEVELIGCVQVNDDSEAGEITVPAKKFLDICKSLPDQSSIEFTQEEERVIIKSGRSRFTLSTLPASDFPNIEESTGSIEFALSQNQLKRLMDRTSFAMAQQDVRYYLNGMLFELTPGLLRVVATDGHRLAMCSVNSSNISTEEKNQVIIPRKGIIELTRLLEDSDDVVNLSISNNHIRAKTGAFTYTSKLVDGNFPDYERVLPKGGNKTVLGDRQVLKQAFTRVSILSNEKFRGVRLLLSDGILKILANNPEQEEAEEEVTVDYQGDSLEVGFNVGYMMDVLSVLSGDRAKIILSDPNSSALIEEAEEGDSLYVVMPMRL